MKKPVVGLALGLFALLFMLSSAAWAVSANEHYQVNDDVQSNQSQITLGNLLSSNEDNKLPWVIYCLLTKTINKPCTLR